MSPLFRRRDRLKGSWMTAQAQPADPRAAKPLSAHSLDDQDSADVFESMLSQQLALFEQLQQLAAQQTDSVEQGRSDQLLTVLGQRQRLIDQLTAIQQQMAPFRNDWSAFYDRLDEAQRRRIGGRLEAVQTRLACIIEQDERDKSHLADACNQVGGQLNSVVATGAALRAYGGRPRGVQPRFTSQKG